MDTATSADGTTIAYETAVFANRASEVLSPQLVDELRYIVGYPP